MKKKEKKTKSTNRKKKKLWNTVRTRTCSDINFKCKTKRHSSQAQTQDTLIWRGLPSEATSTAEAHEKIYWQLNTECMIEYKGVLLVLS